MSKGPKKDALVTRFERVFPGFLEEYEDGYGCGHCMEHILAMWDSVRTDGGPFNMSGWQSCSNFEAIFDCVYRSDSGGIRYRLEPKPPEPNIEELQIVSSDGTVRDRLAYTDSEIRMFYRRSKGSFWNMFRSKGEFDCTALAQHIQDELNALRRDLMSNKIGCELETELAHWRSLARSMVGLSARR